MAINRINETDLQGKLVSQLSNRPTDPRSAGGDNMTAQEVKARHDALGLLVKDKLNELLDALNNATVDGEPVTPLSDLITVVADGVSKSLTDWIENKYSLPLTGIPKDDLSDGVKASLELADSAYQLPEGGIPASDLTEAVQTILTNAVSQSEFASVKALAEGADKVLTSDSYSALSTLLNGAAKTDYKVGQKILVGAAGVPDVWVYAVSDSSVSYTYTNDSAFEASLVAGTLQIGYFSLRPLEAKTDLTGYATETYVGTAIAANVDATLATTGKSADAKAVGDALALKATESDVVLLKADARTQNRRLVVVDKDSDELLAGNYVDPNSGNYYNWSGLEGYTLLKAFPVQNGQTFIFNGAKSFCLFDSQKHYISSSGFTFQSRTVEEKTISNENAAYMSVNFENQYDFGLVRVLDHDYQVINMGDSIFGFNCPPYDVSTYIERKCGIRTLNGAFGGSQASVHPTAEYAKFSFHALADAIYDEDFSTQTEANFTTLGYKYKFNITNLAAVDFSKVKVITVAYGTNDWNNDDQLDNESNKYDTTTYLGAIRYGIEKILSKYPHINIILCSPIYRGFTNGDSDDTPNYNGVYLYEFGEGLKSVAEEYHLPFVDNYHDLGLNALTASTLLISDKTHPNAAGVKRLAGKMASVIEDYIDAE